VIRRLLRSLRPRAAAYFRKRVFARGIDATEEMTPGRALILAPHADDEAIGCGALIARKAAAGTEVVIVIASDGRASKRAAELGGDELARLRRTEAIDAASALGVPQEAVRFLDFEDSTLDQNRTPLLQAITRVAEEVQPDEIYSPHADQHDDHRALSEVGRTAFAGGAARFFEYPVRYWVRVPWVLPQPNRLGALIHFALDPIEEWRRPRARLVRTAEFRSRKLDALAVYAGEMANVGHFVYEFADDEYEVFFPH
jgi:LmbE family N-acetylglucosaminyl deacetylase